MSKHPKHIRCDANEGWWKWCRSRPTCCLVGKLGVGGLRGACWGTCSCRAGWRGERSLGSPVCETISFYSNKYSRELCNYLPGHSVSQHVFISLLVCLSIIFRPLKTTLQTAGDQYTKLRLPWTLPNTCVRGKSRWCKLILPELSHVKTPQLVANWMWVVPSPLHYSHRVKEHEPGLNIWPLE